ncbi:MAG TPA: hypothetical protein VMU59_15620 [Caulobacteraceae bacterium]|nr:hypothetical protein [Caulobacteraceae bacterium]
MAVIFALSATALIAFLGAGLDFSRAFVARQELSNVATMTCQYSTRPTVYQVAFGNNNGLQTYATQVNAFATQSLANQQFSLTQTNATPFTYTALGSNGQVSLAATVPTLFLPIVSINNLPVSVTITCAQGQTQTQNSGGNTPGSVVLSESFENSACSGTCWSTFQPDGTKNNLSPTTYSTFSNVVGYVGTSGSEWTIMGYCLEVDTVGLIKSTVADGTHSAELDCDNASGSAGNSSISNKTFYSPGVYEIRFAYASRIDYPNYDPMYICASTAADLAWANDGSESGSPRGSNITRSNQMNVYFDADQNGVAPTHTTLDGTQTLAGSNLIDECVYGPNWVQRSVTINVTTAGYYWLSFAADGGNDSYGAQVDAIEVCHVACSGSISDPFPSAWSSSPLLYEDSFESPSSATSPVKTSAVLDSDYGASHGGWPTQANLGWATGPYDQVGIVRGTGLVDAGSQSLELDSATSGSQTTSRRSISRYFYLDPGYYAISYHYLSGVRFTGVAATNCTYAPSSSGALSAYTSTTSTAGTNLLTSASGNWPADTNAVAVFMAQSMEASYPVIGAGLNNATSYYNPTGTTTTTPTAAPDTVSTSSYNTAQVNPVLDYCNYSSSWTTRTTYVQITKAGQYWLTIGAVGASASQDHIGGLIDDVRVSAVGSLYGGAPTFYVTIPTTSAAPGSTISYTGFSFTADPLTPS